jgi:hypothetical protein
VNTRQWGTGVKTNAKGGTDAQLCENQWMWRHLRPERATTSFQMRHSQGVTFPIALSTSLSSPSCVSAPRIGLVPHYCFQFNPVATTTAGMKLRLSWGWLASFENSRPADLWSILLKYWFKIFFHRPSSDFKTLNANLPSVWVKIVSSWVCMVIYIWTMIAPAVLTDREFDWLEQDRYRHLDGEML